MPKSDKYDVFISYRREGGLETPRLIKDRLEERGKHVFLDVTELRTGLFNKQLLKRIAEADDFIIILYPGSLDRCKEPNDWIKREITEAIKLEKNIIPIIKDGFTFPKEDDIPDEIKSLIDYQGIPYNVKEYFEAFVTRLSSFLTHEESFANGISEIFRKQEKPVSEIIAIEMQKEKANTEKLITNPKSESRCCPYYLPKEKEQFTTQMIGRENEFAMLQGEFTTCLNKNRRIVFIEGEAGIGKTRMVRELYSKQNIESGNLIWLEGRCSKLQTKIYEPFINMLESLFGLGEEDASEKAHRIRLTIEQLFPTQSESEGFLLYLGRLHSIRYNDISLNSKMDMLPDNTFGDRISEHLPVFFDRLAKEQPVIMILDDLHYADRPTLDLVSRIIDENPFASIPLMFVCLYRFEGKYLQELDDLRKEKLSRAPSRIIELKRLPKNEIAPLLVLEDIKERNAEEIKNFIWEKSAGNPFFVEQYILFLKDRNWEYDAGIPDKIESLILDRLESLEEPAKEIIIIASVIGVRFKNSLLEHLLLKKYDKEKIVSCLVELEKQSLIYIKDRIIRRNEEILTYAFNHEITQEAIYQSIPNELRSQYHQQIAEGIEKLNPGSLENWYEELAAHYSRTNNVDKAVEYLLKSGEKEIRLSNNAQAEEYLKEGIRIVGKISDETMRFTREKDLQLALAGSLIATKGRGSQEIVNAYERIRELNLKLNKEEDIFLLYFLARFYGARAEHEKCCKIGKEIMKIAERNGKPLDMVLAKYILGESSLICGKPMQAQEYLSQVVGKYDSIWDTILTFRQGCNLKVLALSYLSWAKWFLGYPDQSQKASSEAISLARGLDHPLSLVSALSSAGAALHAFRLDFGIMEELTNELKTISNKQDFAFFQATYKLYEGLIEGEKGGFEEGLATLCQGLDSLREREVYLYAPNALIMKAHICEKAGWADKGLCALKEAEALIRNSQECYYEAELYRYRGALLSVKGEPDTEVEACFRRAIEIAQAQQARMFEIRAAVCLGRLLRRQGKMNEARKMLEEIYNWFREGFDTTDLKSAKSLLDRL